MNSSYKGADRGALIFSAGAIGWATPIELRYRKVGQRSGVAFGGDGIMSANNHSIFDPEPDFKGRETGMVGVHYLEPGDYEIYTWQVNGAIPGIATVNTSPAQPFSIPFKIYPGKATYIGNFSRVSDLNGGFSAQIGYLVASDRHERDIPIARKKEPSLPDVEISVFDVTALRLPFLVSRERP